jgi:hypothetical protein
MRRVACWVVIIGLVAACGGPSTSEPSVSTSGTPSTSQASTSSSSTTVAPTTTTTTTTSSTTTAGPAGIVLEGALVFSGGEPLAPTLELRELHGSRTVSVPLDRRLPNVLSVVSDGDRGLVALLGYGGLARPGPTVLLPANGMPADGPVVEGGWELQSSRFRGEPAVVFLRKAHEQWPEQDRDVMETTTEVVVARLDSRDEEVLERAVVREEFAHSTHETDVVSPELVMASYGGGVLVTSWWHDGCGWLQMTGTESGKVPVNPWPADACFSGGVAAHISVDGRWLVLNLHSGDSDPWLGVLDAASGELVGEVTMPGYASTTSYLYDGDNTLAAFGEGEPTPEVILGSWPEGNWSTDSVAIDTTSPLIGVLGGTIEVFEDTTAFPPGLAGCDIHEMTLPAIAGLPAAVDATRRLIAEAVSRCDLTGLDDLARTSAGFITGKPGAEDICGQALALPLDDRDLVPVLFAQDLTALPDLLAQEPEFVDGFFGPSYVWSEDPGFRIVIDEQGNWVNYDHTEEVEPCETIWCTC